MPWIYIDAFDPYYTGEPAGDSTDYQTGTGVFMRYLLQAYNADSTILQQEYKDQIVASANDIIHPGFGTRADPFGNCDSYSSAGNNAADYMTAYINRLAELLLAIVISD